MFLFRKSSAIVEDDSHKQHKTFRLRTQDIRKMDANSIIESPRHFLVGPADGDAQLIEVMKAAVRERTDLLTGPW